MTRRLARARSGFALLAVLWVMVGIAALSLAARVSTRDALAASRNRLAATAGRWQAEGCAERARSTVDAALGHAGDDGVVAGAWSALDSLVAVRPLGPECDVDLVPTGVALDVNQADAETLRRLLRALRAGTSSSAIADAILDWRDRDQVPRSEGAESDWYRHRHLFQPRDGPFASVHELRRVRGVADVPALAAALEASLTVEPGRIVLGRAPAPVLLALPGMTEEGVARLFDLRSRGERAIDLARFGALLSPAARDTMLAYNAELMRLVAREPDAWLLIARARHGERGPAVGVELRLVHAGSRAAVVRRRSWQGRPTEAPQP